MPDITERSEELNDIIGRQPSWLLRYGIMSIFFMTLLLVIISGFIKYPDVINSKVMISTAQPPIELVSTGNLPIEKKIIQENGSVRKDDWILYLSPSVNYTQIIHLRQQLSALKQYTWTMPDILSHPISFYDDLGELQPAFNAFYQAQENIRNYTRIRSYQKKSVEISQRLGHTQQLSGTIQEQYQLNIKDLQILEQNLQRSKSLYADGVISKVELETEERNYLRKKMEINQTMQSLKNTSINQEIINKEQVDTQVSDEEYKSQLIQVYNSALNELKSNIEQWISKSVVVSPIAGKVAYYDKLEEGQYLVAGQKLLSVVPPSSSQLIGKGYFPVENSGKVKVGNKVLLKMDAYSFKEYGIVEGKITHISAVPVEGKYSYEMSLPNQLITKYKDKINFKQQMTATGEIITVDQTLLQRVLYQFKDLWENKTVSN